MQEKEKLSLIDSETISEAIMEMVAEYPDLPFHASAKNILWQSIADTESIGLFTLQGAVYLSRYVSGSYIAQFPFRIVYKCSPGGNRERMDKQNFVSDLSAWLEKCTATFKDTRILLQSIDRTSPVYKKGADNGGAEEYTCTMNLKYMFKKKG